jgi:hypothetical protein
VRDRYAEDVADVDVAAGAVRAGRRDAAAVALGDLADAALRAVGVAAAVDLEGVEPWWILVNPYHPLYTFLSMDSPVDGSRGTRTLASIGAPA